MGADSRGTIFLFTVLAILMTIGAGLESFCKWNKKSGALCSLAIGCAVFQYKWYDRWHKVASEYAAERNESNLRKVFKLADDHLKASNSKIIEIQNKAAALGMIDLALKSSFLSPEDKFKVPLEHKRIDPSSGGNGRSVEGQAIPQYSNGDRGLLIRERH